MHTSPVGNDTQPGRHGRSWRNLLAAHVRPDRCQQGWVIGSARDAQVDVEYQHDDAACIHKLTTRSDYDVVVTDSRFGDIVTDLASAIGAGVGPMRSAHYTSGSANSLGVAWSAAMTVRERGFEDATAVDDAVVGPLAPAGRVTGCTNEIVAALMGGPEAVHAR